MAEVKKDPRDFLIFPLDVASADEALGLVECLSSHVGMFKIGLELFVRCGPDIVKTVQAKSPAGIFLDLKLHDIPVTVERAMSVVADLGVTFVTVHCGESERMLAAAVDGGRGRVGVLGVTVLTSVSKDDIRAAGFRPEYAETATRLVAQRARMARRAGCAGVVCSGLEVDAVAQACGPDFIKVTPGIRPEWSLTAGDDQQRVMTPGRAIAAGADYLVVGRPIRDADDPAAAARQVVEEIANAVR